MAKSCATLENCVKVLNKVCFCTASLCLLCFKQGISGAVENILKVYLKLLGAKGSLFLQPPHRGLRGRALLQPALRDRAADQLDHLDPRRAAPLYVRAFSPADSNAFAAAPWRS